MNVHSFEHVPFEGLAGIDPWLKNRGHSVSRTRFWLNDPTPDMDNLDWLIVMGGPMGVHDEKIHPWLRHEKRFIEQAIKREKHVLGICLGAQLIADVLGARVSTGKEPEIGWFPVSLTANAIRSRWFHSSPFVPFHWHRDSFALPHGAIHLAISKGCENQAFSYGDRVLALQFHPDSTAESIDHLLLNCADDLVPGTYVQSAEEIRNMQTQFQPNLEGILHSVLEAFRTEVVAQ